MRQGHVRMHSLHCASATATENNCGKPIKSGLIDYVTAITGHLKKSY